MRAPSGAWSFRRIRSAAAAYAYRLTRFGLTGAALCEIRQRKPRSGTAPALSEMPGWKLYAAERADLGSESTSLPVAPASGSEALSRPGDRVFLLVPKRLSPTTLAFGFAERAALRRFDDPTASGCATSVQPGGADRSSVASRLGQFRIHFLAGG